MSDFLTNLVMRSFSGTPAVQPMTFSTYAAPEPVDIDQPQQETFAQKPMKTTPIVPVQDTDKHESVAPVVRIAEPAKSVEPGQAGEVHEIAEVADLIIPTIQTQIPEPQKPLVIKEKSVSPPPVTETKPPRVNRKSTIPEPNKIVEKTETKTETKTEFKTEIQPAPPAQLIYRTPIQTVQPTTRRLTKTQPNPVSSPAQTTPASPTAPGRPEHKPAQPQKHDLEIVEQVIERPSVTIENTQQVTTSFTTLIPNTTARPLPTLNLRPRAKTLPPDAPAEAEPPAPTPETVINVAIGRIEIRATPATTPTRERQQHGPKVRTLDDYLQQRSRGTQ